MKAKAYCVVSGLVFTLVALAHAVRAARDVEMLIGGSPVPVSVSWGFTAVAGALAVWGFRLAAK